MAWNYGIAARFNTMRSTDFVLLPDHRKLRQKQESCETLPMRRKRLRKQPRTKRARHVLEERFYVSDRLELDINQQIRCFELGDSQCHLSDALLRPNNNQKLLISSSAVERNSRIPRTCTSHVKRVHKNLRVFRFTKLIYSYHSPVFNIFPQLLRS